MNCPDALAGYERRAAPQPDEETVQQDNDKKNE